MKKVGKFLALLISVISLIGIMTVAVSAAKTVSVGQSIELPKSGKRNDYSPALDFFEASDDSIVSITSVYHATFLKEGTVTITGVWKQWDGENPVPKTGTYYNETFNVVGSVPVQTTNIKLDSGTFSGGKEFPAFTVVNEPNCYIEEATFYKEMTDYYVGDTLPSYSAGTTINYVSITLKPKAGYFFGWGGTNDGKKHESNVYTVEYKGKKYIPNVVHDEKNNEMHVYVDVTFEEGQIYATTFKDLDAPYHYGPLDKTVTTNSDVELVSVKYTMFGKELTEFEKGDTVGITVRVKSKDPKNTFNANGYAYWMEQKMNSVNTKLISSTEAEYTFSYKVDAIDSQIIKWADFTMPGVFAGESLPANAFSKTDGITVKSVTWTPNDEKADANKEYTVKIELEKKNEFLYADDFEEQAVVSINGERAKLLNEKSSSGGGGKGKFQITKYYAEATFKPTVVVNTNTGTTTGTETTTGTVTGKVEGADKTEPTDKSENENDEDATETEEYKFPFTDVPESQWYYGSVKSAHQMGLINGKTATLYMPDDNMTYAEAVKLAVCMNILYDGGNPAEDIKNGKDVWFSTYMDYALDNGIIDEDLTSKANEKITRKDYVYIFSNALPAEAFAEKNNIPADSIPDVKEDKFAQNRAIYMFYRAGILSGVDAKGTFNPSDNIKRSEVAAILIRMMDESARVGAPAELGK